MAYDFSTLDHHDFELFARDIINATFGMDLQDFKVGKDKGVDLRYSTPLNSNSIVVQVKHWLKSGYDRLYTEMEKAELFKIKDLAPDRYLLVTSVSLGTKEKDEIVALISPYIQSANDVFGKEDLNKYLSTLPDIEKKWYKLWLTSTNIMQQVLHNGILGANEFVASKILRTTQLYVHSPSYDVAFDILKEHKYLLITGQPGVGKTTLAYYLTYHYLAKGYQLLHVDTDISQATTLLSNDPSIKQIIFFDDFLGENYLEINRPKTTESAFVLFLERIQASENKFLILTTRTTIYTNAQGKYEKLDRMKVDIARKEIVLDQYTILDKARILLKHIYYSELAEEYKEIFFTNKNYWTVIDHSSYNPRLIEFVTSKKHVPKGTPAEYWLFVQRTLHNPKEVWKYFYEHQLSVEERILLHIIFTQNYSATAEDTKQLFHHMLEFEVHHYQHRPGLSPFQNASKRLLDGTIKKELHSYNMKGRFSFINPSLADFLKYHFLNSEEERRKLLLGAWSIEQFEHYKQNFFIFEVTMQDEERKEPTWFAELLMERASSLITYQELKREASREKYICLRMAALLNRFRTNNTATDEQIEQFKLDAVRQYPIDCINTESREFYVDTIGDISRYSELYAYVESNWTKILNALFRSCVRESDFEDVKELFYNYDQRYSTYIADSDNESILADSLQDLANDRTEEWIEDERRAVQSEDEWISLKQKIVRKRADFFALFDLEDDWYDETDYFDDDNRDTIFEENIARIKEQTRETPENKQQVTTTADEHHIRQIEILFTGNYDPAFVKKKAEELSLPF